MKKILKISMIIVSLLGFSVTYSKAFVMDVWELKGADPAAVSEATLAF